MLARRGFASGVLALLSALSAQGLAGTPTPFVPASDGQITLYRNATLIDGTGGPVQLHMDVLVRGQRIAAVFADGKSRPDISGARIVDLSGHFLMPGLIDSHVHLATPPNRRQAEAMLRRDLYGGVTTVRDMADDLRSLGDITRASRVGEIPGPDIYYAALMAGPSFFKDPRTVQVTAGAVPGDVPWMQAITDQTDLPLAVAMARGTYATALKLYADLPPTLVQRITTEAHRQHILVWTHATIFPARPSDAVDAGVDTISHACLLIYQAVANPGASVDRRVSVSLDQFKDGRSPVLAKLFADMAKRGTILDATVWTYSAIQNDPKSNPKIARHKCDGELGATIARQAFLAGVPISTGTDNAAQWDDPWPDLFHELDWLSNHAHIPTVALLRSATLVGARAAGQERNMGTITPGKLANMVVLARNPLDSVTNLKSVVFTIKRGRIFLRKEFVPLKHGDIVDF
jgi:imidazolonepropionase-like amidohydrolase